MKAQKDTRRRSQRFTVKDTVFLTFRPGFDKMGRLKDISKSGVAFEYISLDRQAESGTLEYESVEVDIFSNAKGLYLSRVPCKIVYDVRTADFFGRKLFENRRCGLKFGPLSHNQKAQLVALLHPVQRNSQCIETEND